MTPLLGLVETKLLLDRLRAWLRRQRKPIHRLSGIAVALALIAVTVFGFSYRSARARLHDKRAQLEQAETTLAELQAELEAVLEDQGLTDAELWETQVAIGAAIDARTWIDAAANNTLTEVAAVDTSQSEIDSARFLTALHTRTRSRLASMA